MYCYVKCQLIHVHAFSVLDHLYNVTKDKHNFLLGTDRQGLRLALKFEETIALPFILLLSKPEDSPELHMYTLVVQIITQK